MAAALVISQSSIMANNPAQAGAIANGIFISFPWLVNIATRLITREGWKNLWLKPRIRRGWRFYLAIWLLPFLTTIGGGLIFYLLFPQSIDPNLSVVRKLAESSPLTATTNPWALLLTITLSLVFISAPINTMVSMEEEFGWLAYLLPKLMLHFAKSGFVDNGSAGTCTGASKFAVGFFAVGARKSVLLTGVIHGLWHLPLILMTTSLTPGITVLPPVIYLLFTCSLSTLLSWGTLKCSSVCILKKRQLLIGFTSLNPYLPKQPKIEWQFGVPFWGHGYVTEIGKVAISSAFATTNVEAIYGMSNSENKASKRVLEKIGMTCLGLLDFRGEQDMFYKINRTSLLQ